MEINTDRTTTNLNLFVFIIVFYGVQVERWYLQIFSIRARTMPGGNLVIIRVYCFIFIIIINELSPNVITVEHQSTVHNSYD